ncbi:fibronectin type III domain-containing protein [Cellulophaga sp. Ld12]|uniref:fibronectin type III domain-containing protein n=1 Tax=Cellulophaga sp. Ld12 TaxID=3229535 RepID=UPI003868FAC5
MKNNKLFTLTLFISSFFILSSCSSDDDEETTIPPNPSNFTITSKDITDTDFTIDWSAATIEGTEGVEYDIYLDDTLVASDLEVLTYTFSNLSVETTYDAKVTSKSIEFGTTSTQVIEVTTSALPIPSAFDLTSKDITITDFTIDWTAATVEGNDGVAYDIYLDDTMVASDLEVLTYTFSNLNAETTYDAKVIAKSNAFETTSTQVIDVTTLALPIPSAFDLTAKDITITDFTIDWTAATIDGNDGVVYDIYLDDTLVASDLEVLTYTFSNLNAETTYDAKVIAKSNAFETTSTQQIELTTQSAPAPNDFTLTLDSNGTNSANISWSSLTIDGPGGVLADIYINNNEEATGVTSSGYVFTGLTANTEYTVRITARSTAYGTTLDKEITFTTAALPTTFEVTSATLYPRTTGTFASAPSMIIRFTDRDLLDGIILNGMTYTNYLFAGSDGITISLSDAEYDALSSATTKEGIADFTENEQSSSKTFTYTVN